MLRSLTLRRYRAFEDVTVELGPLTAFVGPNASGKTSILKACAGGRFVRSDIRDRTGSSHLLRRFAHGSADESLSLTKDGDLRSLGPLLHLDLDAMREHRVSNSSGALTADGSNLADVLAALGRRGLEQLAREFERLVPVFRDVDLRAGGGRHRVVFRDRWAEELWYEPSQVSDGSLFALALLALAHQTEPTELVAIEEPEHGLHPYLLSSIVDVLRALSTRRDRPIQIVIATHSSELLDLLRPEEVRFLTRQSDGSVSIHAARTDTATWKDAYAAHQESLASLWLSGSAGGVP